MIHSTDDHSFLDKVVIGWPVVEGTNHVKGARNFNLEWAKWWLQLFKASSFSVAALRSIPSPFRVHSFDCKSLYVNELTRLSQLLMLTKRRRLPRASWAASGGFSRSSSSRHTRPIWLLFSPSSAWLRPLSPSRIWLIRTKSPMAHWKADPPWHSSEYERIFKSWIIQVIIFFSFEILGLENWNVSKDVALHGEQAPVSVRLHLRGRY